MAFSQYRFLIVFSISIIGYHTTKAKWNIINVARGVGRSVDILKQYVRKVPITIVHYDAIPDNADADLSQAMLTDRSGLPLDEVVIRKMDFERFINTLTEAEADYIRYKMVDELPVPLGATCGPENCDEIPEKADSRIVVVEE